MLVESFSLETYGLGLLKAYRSFFLLILISTSCYWYGIQTFLHSNGFHSLHVKQNGFPGQNCGYQRIHLNECTCCCGCVVRHYRHESHKFPQKNQNFRWKLYEINLTYGEFFFTYVGLFSPADTAHVSTFEPTDNQLK